MNLEESYLKYTLDQNRRLGQLFPFATTAKQNLRRHGKRKGVLTWRFLGCTSWVPGPWWWTWMCVLGPCWGPCPWVLWGRSCRWGRTSSWAGSGGASRHCCNRRMALGGRLWIRTRTIWKASCCRLGIVCNETSVGRPGKETEMEWSHDFNYTQECRK